MAKTETTTMTTTVIYNDDKTHRYLLQKEWDSTKPSAEIIMLYPSYADTVTVDHTTMFVLQNLEQMDYGSVSIVNLFSSVNGKHSTSDIDEENLMYIECYAEKADVVIFATGTGGDGNKNVLQMQKDVLNMLAPYKSKLKCIADGCGRKFYHPLCPTVRKWTLADFDFTELKAFQQEQPLETPPPAPTFKAVESKSKSNKKSKVTS
ncbi:MAG: DUF1643 domain-containing protein [Oscillospiraceae bacterium]